MNLDSTIPSSPPAISPPSAPPGQTPQSYQPWTPPQGLIDVQGLYSQQIQQSQPITTLPPHYPNYLGSVLPPAVFMALRDMQSSGHASAIVPWFFAQNPNLQSAYANQQGATELNHDQPNRFTNALSGTSVYPTTQSERSSTSLEISPKATPINHIPRIDTPTDQASSSSKGKQREPSESVSDQHMSYPVGSQVSSGTQLFKLESGEELTFFVQIDLSDRFHLVNTIKVSYRAILLLTRSWEVETWR